MKKGCSTLLPVQLSLLISICLNAGFCALVSTGGIGGVTVATAPDFAFGLVGDFVCPGGTHMDFYSVKRSYHEPGESEPHVECVGEDGRREDVTFLALATAFGLTFLLIFAFVFIPMAVLALIAPHKVPNFWKAKRGPKIGAAPEKPASNVRVAYSPTVIYRGQVYTDVNEMPPDVRQAYRQAMAVFADADGDGIPDIFQGRVTAWQGTPTSPPTDDIVLRLKRLKELRDAGLITSQEYEEKKAEILSSL